MNILALLLVPAPARWTVAMVAAVLATPAVLRPVKNTPPGANRCITGENGSAPLAGTPSRNSWPTRARGVIASSVACAHDTGGGVRGRAGTGPDGRAGASAAGSGGTAAQAIAIEQAAIAPPIRNPRSTPLAHHNPAEPSNAARVALGLADTTGTLAR
jgi:hypothetical protein